MLYIDRYGMKRYRDPDEPDWASMFTVSQLEKILERGIDEFDNYPDDIQDAILYDALVGQLPNQVTLDDMDAFYIDYSSKNHSLFSGSYAKRQANKRQLSDSMSSYFIKSIPVYGSLCEVLDTFNDSLYENYGDNKSVLIHGSLRSVPTVVFSIK